MVSLAGFADVLARPDLDTYVLRPWQPQVPACLADLEDPVTREPYAVGTSKASEKERFRRWVTDWEYSDYVQRL